MAESKTELVHLGANRCRQHNYYLHDLPSHIYLRVVLQEPTIDSDNLPSFVRRYTMVAKEMSFSVGKTLRCDTYAKVMLAYSTATNKKIAVKCIHKGYPELRSYIKYILPRETGLLKMLREHPNVVKFIGLVETEKYAILATEYVEGTNLLDYILLKRKLNEDEARTIFKELLKTVATCHSLGICIRGITCENVLLDNALNPKISNFEHAIVRGYDKVDIFKGTIYSPPEVFFSKENEPEPVDVWTLGVILYTMVTGVHPFAMGSALDCKEMCLSFPVSLSTACCNIIRKMLHLSPMKRIKISELKRDGWLEVPLRYIDYHLTDKKFESLSADGKACISHSFSTEITMSKQHSHSFSTEITVSKQHRSGEHELNSDRDDPLEIEHVTSKSKKLLKVKKEEEEKKSVVVEKEETKSINSIEKIGKEIRQMKEEKEKNSSMAVKEKKRSEKKHKKKSMGNVK